MNLQTKIALETQKFNQIDYNSKVALFGSCFSEHIGEKFEYFKFQKLSNPFGILFHSLAIEKFLINAINGELYREEDTFFNNEQFHCFDAHSRLSDVSKSQLVAALNKSLKETRVFLEEASHIVITLGTAWAYRHIESDTYVANCHKVPQKKFLKELLTVDQIQESMSGITSLIKDLNPKITVIFTVSPVRHIKEGIVENTRSKSHLITAIHEIVDPRSHVHYFPAFEIMMDELRDYRFYNADMLHPNDVAISYIWERFINVWLLDEAKLMLKEVDEVQKGLLHRPFNRKSEAHQLFLENLKIKQSLIQTRFTHISFEK